MKLNLNINIKIILLIITFSAVTGIIFNALSEKGIPVFQEIKRNNWAKDNQLFNNIQNDSTTVDGLTHALPKQNQAAQNTNINRDSIKTARDVKSSAQTTAPQAITLAQAYKLYNTGKVLFIDARDQWDFQDSHIKGSINIPYYKFDKNDNNVKKINKSSMIVTYCDAGDCGMSRNLAKSLFKLGYTKTYYFYEGLEAWIKASYPVEKLETE